MDRHLLIAKYVTFDVAWWKWIGFAWIRMRFYFFIIVFILVCFYHVRTIWPKLLLFLLLHLGEGNIFPSNAHLIWTANFKPTKYIQMKSDFCHNIDIIAIIFTLLHCRVKVFHHSHIKSIRFIHIPIYHNCETLLHTFRGNLNVCGEAMSLCILDWLSFCLLITWFYSSHETVIANQNSIANEICAKRELCSRAQQRKKKEKKCELTYRNFQSWAISA